MTTLTTDEVVKMARQAGFIIDDDNPVTFSLEAFAKLVAEREREACAKVCEETISNAQDSWDRGVNTACVELASAIRARGNT